MMTMDLASVKKEAELRAFLLMVSEFAAWHPLYHTVKCLYCKRSVYFEEQLPWALLPGHIYSDRGIDEFRISRCCEYCFDHMFMETDEDQQRCDVCREFDNLTMAPDGMMLCTSCRIREENEADQNPPF